MKLSSKWKHLLVVIEFDAQFVDIDCDISLQIDIIHTHTHTQHEVEQQMASRVFIFGGTAERKKGGDTSKWMANCTLGNE